MKVLTVNSDDAGDPIVFTCAPGLLIDGEPPPSGAVACTEVSRLDVFGNGGADTIDVGALEGDELPTSTLDGGAGDDSLRGRGPDTSSGGTVTLLGGEGADTLDTNQGSDPAQGGPGDDRIVGLSIGSDGGEGTDTYAFDFAPIAGVNFTVTVADTGLTLSSPGIAATQSLAWTSIEAVDFALNDNAWQFDASAFSGTARVLAKGGADTLVGTGNNDVLDGGVGNDFIDGGGGADVYMGGAGFDYLRARDNVGDSGDCGADDDTVTGDPSDTFTGCERVDLGPTPTPTPAPTPAPDTSAPALTAGNATLRGRTLRVRVACPATEVRCVGIAKLAGVGARPRRPVALGVVTLNLAGAASKTLTARVSRARRRALRKLSRRRLRVSLDVIDAAGNRARKAQRVKLRLR